MSESRALLQLFQLQQGRIRGQEPVIRHFFRVGFDIEQSDSPVIGSGFRKASYPFFRSQFYLITFYQFETNSHFFRILDFFLWVILSVKEIFHWIVNRLITWLWSPNYGSSFSNHLKNKYISKGFVLWFCKVKDIKFILSSNNMILKMLRPRL